MKHISDEVKSLSSALANQHDEKRRCRADKEKVLSRIPGISVLKRVFINIDYLSSWWNGPGVC